MRALGDHRRAQDGFTLIEVLVAALIVLIISSGVATALISANDYTSHERNQSQANAVAEQDQERLKSMSDSQLTALHQTRTVTLNNTKFTVTSTASFLDANGGSSCSSKTVAYFKLTSTVTSVPTAGNPAQTVTEETIITRSLAGSLVVKVVDQTGTPLQGAAVNATGQNTNYAASATTDANGCTAFAGLPTDTYAITATDPGYVDPNGNTAASESAGVTASGVTAPPTLVLGPAAAIKVGFRTAGTSVLYDQYTSPAPSGHGIAPAGFELSYYGMGGGNNMNNPGCLIASAACSGSTTTSGSPPVTTTAYSASTGTYYLSPGNLFPFYVNSSSQYTNNYQVWAGSCEEEQPLQPPAGTGTATVPAGHSASTTPTPDAIVDEPAIDVAVKSGGGTAVVPSHVTITFSGQNSGGTAKCVDVWHQVPAVGTETVSGTTYGTYPAPFASTAAKGSTSPMASATGDPGTIQVCADYSGYYAQSAPLTTTNFNAPTMVPVMDVKTGTGAATHGTGSCP